MPEVLVLQRLLKKFLNPVMAKKLSKRISERKKTKIARKNSRKEAKIRKEQIKKQKSIAKVPKSYLISDEEKAHLKTVKDAAQQRSLEYQKPEEKEPSHIVELKRCISEHMCDAFIEVLDFRDIEGSRSRSSEDLLKSNGKKVYAFVNFADDMFDATFPFQNDGLTVLHDLSILLGSKRICIFGNCKTGKFLLSKSIEALGTDAMDFEFVRTPARKTSVAEVLRGQIDLKDINPGVMFGQVWKFINEEEIKGFYALRSFDGCDAFLDVLSDKIAEDTNSKKSLSGAALKFFKDTLMGRIRWMKHQDDFSFIFVGS